MSSRRSRRGSRAGVPNRERPAVATSAAACPTCLCTAYRVEGRTRERDFGGPISIELQGRPVRFSRIVYRPVVCQNEACGQHYIIREYHLDPEHATPESVD